MRLLQVATALFVPAFALPALALSLGSPQGSAWIGQPLSLRVPLTLDADAAAGALCPHVELRQGDAALPDGPLSVALEPGTEAGRPQLRIRSSRAIEEPVLHLRVRVGCAGTASRDFVLLADPPPVTAALPVRATDRMADVAPHAAASVAASAALAAGAPARRRAPAAGTGGTATRRVPALAAARAPVPAAGAATAARPADAAAARQAQAAPGPRLQIDALEPLPPRALSGALASTTGTGPAPHETAAGATAPVAATLVAVAPGPADGEPAPSDTLAQAQRTAQLEAALAELRAQAQQNQQTLAELRSELAQARDSRYSNPLVYGLLLLLLMAAAALLALWRIVQRPAASPWAVTVAAGAADPPRRASKSAVRRRPGADDDDDDAQAQSGDAQVYFPAVAAIGAQDADDEGAREPDDSAAGQLPGASRVSVWDDAAQPGMVAEPAHALNADELFDVQQQAEFFMSLGQHDKAIDTLTDYVVAHPETSALAYLELLHIYHQLRREAEYEQLRQQCQQALNVRVPAFRDFGAAAGRTLEHYPEARTRLQSHWPHVQTLAVIEDLLFRRGHGAGTDVFDLAAYRELLMLYALVQEREFSDTDEWPALDELLRLPRAGERPAQAVAPARSANACPTPPAEAAQAPARRPDRFDQVLDPQRGDFEPTWPPQMELDIDLSVLGARPIDTIPLALRRAAAAQAHPPPVLSEEVGPASAELAGAPPPGAALSR